MKKNIIFICAFVFTNFGFSQGITKRVLFLGNSYTYVNDLPTMLANLANADGNTLIKDQNTPGGYQLVQHAANAVTISKIFSQDWDFVVLQEQSQKPSFSDAQVASDVYPYAAQLDSMIKQNNSCTKTAFFMTWGRKYGDQMNCASYPPVCTFLGMQARLRKSYLEMGYNHDAPVAPVGEAFKNSMTADSSIDLYSSDYSHPSVYGSYLAACVFYATLYQKTPVGVNWRPSAIDSLEADFLQNIAHNTVFDSLTTWNIYSADTIQAFAHTTQVDDTTFQFSYDSTQSNLKNLTFTWYFGTGDSSFQQNPTYVFPNGTFFPYLEVTNGCVKDTVTFKVAVHIVGIDEQVSQELKIFPNPSRDQLSVVVNNEMTGKFKAQIFELSGKKVFENDLTLISGKGKFNFNLENGVYIMKLLGKKQVFTRKIVILD